MSTQATISALNLLRSTSEVGSIAYDLTTIALAEVGAIERAAVDLTEIWGYAGDGNPTEMLIRGIADEAFQRAISGHQNTPTAARPG